MRSPALTRVISVFLAIMGLVLCFTGGYGIYRTLEDRKENQRKYEVLCGRIDKYSAITERTEGESYEKTSDELEKLREKHRKRKADYNFKLSTYTATKGGLKQGEEMMSSSLSASSILSQAENKVNDFLSSPEFAQLQDDTNVAYAEYMMAQERINEIEAQMAELDPESEEYLVLSLELQAAQAEQMVAFGVYQSYAAEMESKMPDMNAAMSGMKEAAAGIDQLINGVTQMATMKLQNIKDSVLLSIEKEELVREQEEIDRLNDKAVSLLSDERSLKSIKANFLLNENIAETMEKSNDILSAARSEADRMGRANRQDLILRLLLNGFMLAAAAASFMGIPAAFERKSGRKWLVLPPVIYTLLSAGAEVINVLHLGEQNYAALFAAIFGAMYLFIIRPVKKRSEAE